MFYTLPLATPQSNLPSYVHPTLQRYTPTLQMVDDLCAGPLHWWKQAPQYLYKWTDESDATFAYRSTCEPLFMGLHRTINAGVGMLWAKDPSIDWGPQETLFQPLWDNIDAVGSKGTVFNAHLSRLTLKHGLALILVDHTAPPPGTQVTLANQQTLNLRPVWRLYSRRNVVNWATRLVNNVEVLSRVTLREVVSIPEADGFGVTEVATFRVVELNELGFAVWRVLEERKDSQGHVQLHERARGDFRDTRGKLRTTLPVAIAAVGGDDVRVTLDAMIPLEGVAFGNLGHWRYATGLTFGREVCGYEQMVVTGNLMRHPNDPDDAPPRMRVGPLVAVHVEQGGSVQWIAPSGTGLAQLEKGCAEKMEQMDKQGLGFLVPQQRSTATATEVRLTAHAQLSTLAEAGKSIADAINMALELTAWYLGLEKAQAPVLSLQTDFSDTAMPADIMTVYSTLVGHGFPKRLVLRALQDGGRIPADEDLDALEAEWDGAAEAARMIREEEARLRMAEMNGTISDDDGEDREDNDAATES